MTPATTPTHTSAMTEPTTKVSLFDEVAALNPLTAARVRTRVNGLLSRIEELESCGATTTSTRGQRRGFLRGSAAKYLWRLGRKGASVEDTKKAQWYVERLRAHLEETTK